MKPTDVPHRMLYLFTEHPEAVECVATIRVIERAYVRPEAGMTLAKTKKAMLKALASRLAETLGCPVERITYDPIE
jgi:hypothetical protein